MGVPPITEKEEHPGRAIGSIVMAAGRGSRMKAYEGNKTLLPLVPAASPYHGSHPILLHILRNLPPGPKALVVNYEKDAVMRAARSFDLTLLEQPVLNGTGGALLAAAPFIESVHAESLILTMGDVPLVRRETYLGLVKKLSSHPFVVLGFRPQDKRQYGALDIEHDRVKRIVEWKYWHAIPADQQALLGVFNSGIYAARREALLRHLSVLRSRPHRVLKERDGATVELEEYFVTDLVEYLVQDGLSVGFLVAQDEEEVMGVDDLDSLVRAQEAYKRRSLS
jgi:bifunctional UDP-N-acetylglucosamine pyrophosphorylase/glucosamine-1-phosphate N-acetyltransferase